MQIDKDKSHYPFLPNVFQFVRDCLFLDREFLKKCSLSLCENRKNEVTGDDQRGDVFVEPVGSSSCIIDVVEDDPEYTSDLSDVGDGDGTSDLFDTALLPFVSCEPWQSSRSLPSWIWYIDFM